MANRICPQCGAAQQWTKWRHCACGFDFGSIPPPLPGPESVGAKRSTSGLLNCLSFGQLIVLFGGLSICGFLALIWIAPHSQFLTDFFEHRYGPAVPASGYVQNLDSTDPSVVMSSLSLLKERKNPIAVPRAIQLLHHRDDYISLNAALYLGACQRQEAVPYLIRALRHTAWRADAETTRYLRAITGQDFGTDFSRWQRWWLSEHPESQIDWEAGLGFRPRIPKKL